MANRKKYDCAAYIDKCDGGTPVLVDIAYLIDIRERHRELFDKKYDTKLYCPECMEVQLSLINRAPSYHLRGYKNQKHNPKCPFGLDEIKQGDVNTILDTANSKAISARLNQVIKSLLKREYTEHHPLVVRKCGSSISLDPVRRDNVNNSGSYRYIPCKSLTAPINDDDYNKYMIFYGKVKVEWTLKNPTDTFRRLIIKHCENGHIICSSIVSNDVYEHIKDTNNYNQAFVAMFTQLVWSKDGRYTNFKIPYSDKIIIEKV